MQLQVMKKKYKLVLVQILNENFDRKILFVLIEKYSGKRLRLLTYLYLVTAICMHTETPF